MAYRERPIEKLPAFFETQVVARVGSTDVCLESTGQFFWDW